MRVYVHKTRENAFNGDGGIFGGGSIKKRDIIMSRRKEGEREGGKTTNGFRRRTKCKVVVDWL